MRVTITSRHVVSIAGNCTEGGRRLTSLSRPPDCEHFAFGVHTPPTMSFRAGRQSELAMHLVLAGLSKEPAAHVSSHRPVVGLSFLPDAHVLGLQRPPVSVLRSGLQRPRSMHRPLLPSCHCDGAGPSETNQSRVDEEVGLTRIWPDRQTLGRHTPPPTVLSLELQLLTLMHAAFLASLKILSPAQTHRPVCSFRTVDAGHFFGLQIELPPETVTMALRAEEHSAASMQMPVVPCCTAE